METLRGLLIISFLAVLIVVAIMDYQTQTIHDGCHVIIFVLGVAAIWLFPERGLMDKSIGAFAVSLPMIIITLVIPGAFGGGDIKLMAACGWFVGVKPIVYAMIIGLFSAAIYCVVMLAGKKTGRKEHFALGPWLALGVAVSVFYGNF